MGILDMRAYAWAKETLAHAKKQDDIPDHPMIDMVLDVQHAIIQEKRQSLAD